MGRNNLDLTWHYVEKWADTKPGAEALVFEDERLTWGDFKGRMDRIAKAYLEVGVEKGDRVAMLSMARNDFLTTYMAANKIGAIWLGLSPKLTLDELRYQIGDSQPAVLIALREYLGADLAGTIAALKDEFPCIKKVLVIGEAIDGTEHFAAFTGEPRPGLDGALAKGRAKYQHKNYGHAQEKPQEHRVSVDLFQISFADLPESHSLSLFPVI